MRRRRAVIALVAVLALVGTACEDLVGDATDATDAPAGADADGDAIPADHPGPADDSTSAPDAAPVDGDGSDEDVAGVSTAPGVERIVPPLPVPTTAPTSPVGLRLVAETSNSDGPFELDGAQVDGAFDVRLVVDDDRVVDRVEWQLNGETFRDDDLKAPYTLRYASAMFPIDQWVRSDQTLPGRFRAETGAVVVLTARVFGESGPVEVTATFVIGARADGASPTTTAAPVTTTTPPTTTAAPPPPSGGVPWTIAGGVDVSVALPQGVLGPRTSTPVDPATVSGISFGNGTNRCPTLSWVSTSTSKLPTMTMPPSARIDSRPRLNSPDSM